MRVNVSIVVLVLVGVHILCSFVILDTDVALLGHYSARLKLRLTIFVFQLRQWRSSFFKVLEGVN